MSARNTYDFKSRGNQPKAQIFLNFKMANKNLFEKVQNIATATFSFQTFLLVKLLEKNPITKSNEHHLSWNNCT